MYPPSIYFLTTAVISDAVDDSVSCCFIEARGDVAKSSVNFVMGSWHPSGIDLPFENRQMDNASYSKMKKALFSITLSFFN